MSKPMDTTSNKKGRSQFGKIIGKIFGDKKGHARRRNNNNQTDFVGHGVTTARAARSRPANVETPERPVRNPHGGPLLPPVRPEHEGRLCVVLDMDETLMHTEFLGISHEAALRQEEAGRMTDKSSQPDFMVTLNGGRAAVRMRPLLDMFMRQVCQEFEVVLFTAAQKDYATKMLDHIDPNNLLHYRLYRDSTVTHRGQEYVKDLSFLGRDMQRCVLVDNNFLAMVASPDNCMPIIDFFGSTTDNELKHTLIILRYLQTLPDIRQFLIETFAVRDRLRDTYKWIGEE